MKIENKAVNKVYRFDCPNCRVGLGEKVGNSWTSVVR